MRRLLLSSVTAALVLLSSAPADLVAKDSPALANDFKADDPVETLTVRIDVAAEGADLDEPVALALALGLGFPFWLYPVGRQAGQAPPFGAVARESSAGTVVRAGSSATFTFALKGPPVQDVFETTPQLLTGVRVADISRVGFASRG